MSARVVSVNVGAAREVEWFGRRVTTGIWKSPVAGPVAVDGVKLDGDEQADLRVHGGVDKAVYAYASEDYEWWLQSVDGVASWRPAEAGGVRPPGVAGLSEADPFGPGTFGENLTTAGVDVTGALIGDRWQIGEVVLEVAQPREPCFKLGIRMGDAAFKDRFAEARRPGAYLRIINGGTLEEGMPIGITPAALPAVGIWELVGDEASTELAERVRADARVPDGWRRAFERAHRGE